MHDTDTGRGKGDAPTVEQAIEKARKTLEDVLEKAEEVVEKASGDDTQGAGAAP